MEKLKPCPFCGGEAHMSLGFISKFTIYCRPCRAEIADDNKANLIKKWNTRQEAETNET